MDKNMPKILLDLMGYVEYNTAIEKDGFKGWINIGYWDNISFEKEEKKVVFKNEHLQISFEEVGIEGSCPAEKDNDGCYFKNILRKPEIITENKEFCNCEFNWKIPFGASGKSTGKTLPAIPTKIKNIYPKEDFTIQNAAKIPCEQVLGAYVVKFKR